MKTDKRRSVYVITLVIAILIPLLTGVFSAYLTAGDMKNYETMKHPPLAPPGWLFPIVWTCLYVLMGFASFLVYSSDAESVKKRKALTVYAAQLIMNFFWSTLFFTYGRYLISFIWLLAMWVLILICAIRFYRIHRGAGWMMAGLFVWTTFAAYLNLATFIISL